MTKNSFIKRHIPDTPTDIKTMCDTIGIDSLETLINETIPTSIRKKTKLSIHTTGAQGRGFKVRHVHGNKERQRWGGTIAEHHVGSFRCNGRACSVLEDGPRL